MLSTNPFKTKQDKLPIVSGAALGLAFIAIYQVAVQYTAGVIVGM